MASDGDIAGLQAYLQKHGSLPPSIIRFAVNNGQLATLQYLHQAGLTMPNNVLMIAVYADQRACFEFLISIGCPVNDAVMTQAVKSGRFAYVKYLFTRGLRIPANATSRMVKPTHTEEQSRIILGWLRQHGLAFTEKTAIKAAEQGKIELFCALYADRLRISPSGYEDLIRAAINPIVVNNTPATINGLKYCMAYVIFRRE